ncbi:Lipopolysaccharide kinase (Kdo/WaaP) family protein [Desulfocicer vacuolatum DSM 3385]|uniref:Lipopolysaccharide kinase (Kdo/WaaP) family protein n=1 Tax=Desulfocicer vacuolatum DSM 3385 TaxID=1121400 RepID=A0A1W1ZCF8_9BACT|nr:lipopolysaccharide kinase InaA family protein [Desulfocicer vacuolatum]SMC45728.1 Lipopolysaccharide kinase (Kdo/WaaP) family protein [Desulfocicer vacuolatum DSM 3385]
MTHAEKKVIIIDKKHLTPPFNIALKENGEAFKCTEILRIVPGKRAVLLGEWQKKSVIVKLFYRRFKATGHFHREVEGNHHFKKANIPTAKILHKGSAGDYRAKMLIFDYIYPSKNLDTLLRSCKDREIRWKHLQKLIILVAKMHGAGLQHHDLHLENFLVKDNVLYAIDGSALEVKDKNHALDTQTSLKNLATLFAQRGLEKNSFFKELFFLYCTTREFKDKTKHLALLQRMVKNERKFRIKRYLKKIYRQSTETVCIKGFTSFLLCKRSNYTPAMAKFLEDPDSAFNNPETVMLKNGNSSTVVRFKINGQDLVIKRYNIKNPVHALKRAFQKTRAHGSWYAAHLLLEYGINTPAPIAMKEVRLGPFKSRAYLICDYIEGLSARDYFKDFLPKSDTHLPQKILGIFKKLESLQISHGDMKATNIIVHYGTPFLIDLDSMVQHRSKICFARARNKDVKRFMKNWAEKPEIATIFHPLK